MRVRWTTDAADDLERIGDYIAEGRPESAQRVAQSVVERIGTLETFANLGRIGRVQGTREILLKFQIGADESCAGCVLGLPASVWDSWQRHLGSPQLTQRPDGVYEFPFRETRGRTPAWIYVFDTDTTGSGTPRPLNLKKVIATDADALIHAAFKVVPAAIAAGAGAGDRVLTTIRRRIATWWPELGRGPVEL